MRVTPVDIGVLVRPRVLTHVYLYASATTPTSIEIDGWWKTMRSYRFLTSIRRDQITNTYKKPVDKVFQELKVGNTFSQLETSYTGQITHLIVKVGQNYFLIDSIEAGSKLLQTYQKRYGTRTRVKVCAVGVRFFKGAKRDPDTDSLIPIDPWEGIAADEKEEMPVRLWFYEPKHLVRLEDIIRFESVEVGDLIFFQKSQGVVVNVRELNKPRFFKTCSWCSRTIVVMVANGLIRFLPDRKFQIHKQAPLLPNICYDVIAKEQDVALLVG